MKTILPALASVAFAFSCKAEMAAETIAPNCTCTNPAFVTFNTNGGWSNSGYYVHNNMWNAASGETLYACAYNNWYVTAKFPNTTSVKTYPNVHKDINPPKSLNDDSDISSTFAATAPRAGIYDMAYDIWLNGVASRGCTEFMIWTENYKQTPLGKIQAQATFDGVTYDAYRYTGPGANVITLVPTNIMTSGKLDLKAMFDWAIGKNWMPSNSVVNQICYGVEICSTGNQPVTFCFTDFSVTMKPK